MKILAVIVLMMGCMALLLRPEDVVNEAAQGRATVVAANYAIWRNAVLEHVLVVKPASGDIPLSALALPQAWTPLRPWTARIAGGCCYAFGPASAAEIAAVQALFHGSASIGRVEGGGLVSLYGRGTPTPGIPDGSLVSVIRID